MKTLLAAFAMAGTLAMPVAASPITDVFTGYYAFGDSLTDDGKLGPLVQPPSLGGRFSNGRTYAEYIAELFQAEGLDTGNLALGGATAGPVNATPIAPLSTFAGQIATFGNALLNGVGLPTSLVPAAQAPSAPAPGGNPLFSVFFGANDIFQGQSAVGAANFLADGIRAIAGMGAGFDDFLVMSLPDIGATPAYALTPAEAAAKTLASQQFNAQLALNVLQLESEGLNIVGFDTQSVIEEILADIANGGTMYGILDANIPCTISLRLPGLNCTDLGIDPDTLFFTDSVHPNGKVQELFGARAIAELEQSVAPVPVPASLPLLGAGIAGFVLLRRRRRAA